MLTKRQWLLVLVLGVTAISLSACGGPDQHIWLKSPGWSRAVFLGETIANDPVPVAVHDDGNIYTALLERDEEAEAIYFRIKALDREADTLWERTLTDLPLQRPESLQLLWSDGHLHLFWIQEERLNTLELQADGRPSGNPVLLSGETEVGSYSVVLDPDENPVLWYAGTRENPGVYALASIDGSSPPIQIDPGGVSVQLRYNQAGVMHASWAHYPVGYGVTEIMYASYPSQADWEGTQPVRLHEMAASPTSSFEGPLLGVDETDVYLFWTVVVRSGLEAGAIQTEFIHFPGGQFSEIGRPQPVYVPSIYGLNHEYLPNTYLDAGERVDLQGANLPLTGDVREIHTDASMSEELAISFRSLTEYLWRKEQYQVNVAYFRDGRVSSYQPLSFTSTFSMAPNLISDEHRNLYITWMEKQESGFNTVYFASTSPAIKDALSRSTGREFLRIVAQIVFGVLVGILLAPIAGAAWAMAPLLALFITAPLRKLGSQPVQRFFSIISILGAVVVYWLSKYVTLPGMMAYVPFSAWIPSISLSVGNVLRWAVPILIVAVALFLAWYYTFRQSNPSTLYFLLIYIGVDALLTAAIYAVLIYGAI